jgi:lipopolysaccharide/colanic/teichoic acid biosynthesis glycosyltransferase
MHQQLKRQAMVRSTLERLAAGFALVFCAPLLFAAGACILVETGWPVFFSQRRVGRYGRTFWLVKLRTMYTTNAGHPVTTSTDPRITRVGAVLRRYKVDEVPQLLNILLGQMQFIGPRPEVPRFVELQQPLWRAALLHKPGLTDPATLVYRNEEELLAMYSDVERGYREDVLPRKLLLSTQYQQHRTLVSDLQLILLTIKASVAPTSFDTAAIRQRFARNNQ